MGDLIRISNNLLLCLLVNLNLNWRLCLFDTIWYLFLNYKLKI